jgi:hypothetical protein
MRFFLSLLLSLILAPIAAPQQQQHHTGNTIYDTRVKSVQLLREGWDYSLPLLDMATINEQQLKLQFDLLGNTTETLYYSFIHCDRDWNPSGIFTTDYLSGFPENYIDGFKTSFNTTTDYIHYTISFPNDDIKFLISGNYVVLIHRSGESDRPLLSRRFMIAESAVPVNALVRQPDMGNLRSTHQQLDITLNISRMRITDPHSEIFTVILQNGRWDIAGKGIKPDFISPTEIRFTSLGKNTLFQGGNVFRQFDIRSFRYKSEFVEEITYDGTYYHVKLRPSENREFKPYFFRPDLNGRFTIGVQEGVNPETDADYAWVYFTLPSHTELPDGALHIHGDLTGWAPSQENRLLYNPENRSYEAALFLKQGWYNYIYHFVPSHGGTPDHFHFEGSHFENSNEYLILVYYRARGERYDRLVGKSVITNPAG